MNPITPDEWEQQAFHKAAKGIPPDIVRKLIIRNNNRHLATYMCATILMSIAFKEPDTILRLICMAAYFYLVYPMIKHTGTMLDTVIKSFTEKKV